MWVLLTFLVLLSSTPTAYCQFFECHDDPTFDPDEGPLGELQFTWLGALQYIHVKNGTPHYFRVPRVVLITRQFVLSTAVDAAQIPNGYALGNVAFGDYERDETECRVTIEQLAQGAVCDPAVLLMPIADVLLHPEYKHFGAKNSLAILKLITTIKSSNVAIGSMPPVYQAVAQGTVCDPAVLLMPIADVLVHPDFKHFGATNSLAILKLITTIKSKYMLPACLPFKNYILTRNGRQTKDRLYHVDFTSDVPRDFIEEEKEVNRIRLLPRELCYLYDNPENSTGKVARRMACTTGCGFHSGAPSLVHEHTGHWSIVMLSQGGFPCPDPLRARRPPPPPRHILIHPYVPWITAAITGKAVGAFAKDDPFGFVMPRAGQDTKLGEPGWLGHWWMGGLRCYERGEAADDIFRFYHEIFSLKPTTLTYMSYYLEIDGAHGTLIDCVKVGMPYQMGQPRVWELNTPIVKVRIPLLTFSEMYLLQVEAWAHNATEDVTSEEDSSSSEEEDEYEYYH